MNRRLTAASLAAVTTISLAAAPVHAEENPSSSEAYGACVQFLDEFDKITDENINSDDWVEQVVGAAFKESFAQELEKEGLQGSSNSGTCLRLQLQEGSEYRAGTIAFLTLVPLAIVGVLGAAAVAAGLVPGVALPPLPF